MRVFFSRRAITKVQAAIIAVIIIVAAIAGIAYYYFSQPKGPVVAEVKIGVLYPLSGALAAIGKVIKETVEFAVDEINAAGGIKSLGGAKIRLVWADTRGDPATGANEAERLITEEEVVALFGAYQSAVTLTASDVAERYRVPFLNPESSSAQLTGGLGTGWPERGTKWFFRTGPHDIQFAKVMFKFLEDIQKKTGVKVKTMAIVVEDTLYGKTAADAVEYLNRELKYNYEIVAKILYPAGTASVDAEVMALKAANPDVVWMASYLSDAILFQQTYKRLDFNTKLILTFDAGHTHEDFYKIPESEFVTSRLSWNWDLKKDISRAADQRFYQKYKRHWTCYEAREYTAVYALYWALEEAGKVTTPEKLEEFRTALRDAIKNLNIPGDKIIMPWEGIKFDHTGQNIYAGGVYGQIFWTDLEGKRMTKGEFYTVYPFEVASRDAVFPQPTWAQRG